MRDLSRVMQLMRSFTQTAALLACFACSACRESSPDSPEHAAVSQSAERTAQTISFTDVTSNSGIDMIMRCGELPATQILEVNGGGLALIDFDNDDDLDLFVANGATMHDPKHGPGSRLYENIGDMRFVDVTEKAGINLTRWANGVTVGDYDGDRFDDLYVTCWGPNVLLRNNGDGTFADVTSAAGVGDDRWGTSAAFGDIDGDSDLDLYVVNYLVFDPDNPPPPAVYKGVQVMNGPHGLPAQHDVLYENLGDGTFRDITETSGCLPKHPAFGLNVVINDFDHDGDQDVLVGNDSMQNFLFRNDGSGKFREVGVLSGVSSNIDGTNQATMGMAVGDVSGNGLADVFTTNFSSDTNTLHINEGEFFDDRTRQYGLGIMSRSHLSWACGFYDFDHDGDEDLIYFNGHVHPQATTETMDSEFEQPPTLLRREGSRFEPVSAEEAGEWLSEPHRDRTAVFGDIDRDGDIDVIVGELNGPVRVLRNDGPQGNWIHIALRDGRASSRDHRALGARVMIDDGTREHRRWMFTGGGFQSSSEHAVHVGLPGDVEEVDVTVIWPDGLESRHQLAVRKHHALQRPE